MQPCAVFTAERKVRQRRRSSQKAAVLLTTWPPGDEVCAHVTTRMHALMYPRTQSSQKYPASLLLERSPATTASRIVYIY